MDTRLKTITNFWQEKYNPRIDLVLYQENRQPFALIEMKSGWIDDRDRAKLKEIFPFIYFYPVGSSCAVNSAWKINYHGSAGNTNVTSWKLIFGSKASRSRLRTASGSMALMSFG